MEIINTAIITKKHYQKYVLHALVVLGHRL